MTKKVSAIALASIQNTPRKPITRPLRVDATRKATPLALPTRPFALSLCSSGIKTVTSVKSAIPRKFPAMAPASASTMNTQRMTLEASVKLTGGVETKMMQATAYKKKEIRLESVIAVFFLYRSTRDPRRYPEMATVTRNTPAITDVATTDLVSRYTQKVTANQTNVLIVEATSEFAKTA